MYTNENTPDTFTDEEKLAGAIDIFVALDEDIDYYIREVDDRLYRSGSVLYDNPKITKISEMTYTIHEWNLWYLREHLKEYREMLNER